MQSNNHVFKLTKFCPVGFKQKSYPVQHCSICRGYLIEACSDCIENNKDFDLCVVVNENELYFHKHCLVMVKQ